MTFHETVRQTYFFSKYPPLEDFLELTKVSILEATKELRTGFTMTVKPDADIYKHLTNTAQRESIQKFIQTELGHQFIVEAKKEEDSYVWTIDWFIGL